MNITNDLPGKMKLIISHLQCSKYIAISTHLFHSYEIVSNAFMGGHSPNSFCSISVLLLERVDTKEAVLANWITPSCELSFNRAHMERHSCLSYWKSSLLMLLDPSIIYKKVSCLLVVLKFRTIITSKLLVTIECLGTKCLQYACCIILKHYKQTQS